MRNLPPPSRGAKFRLTGGHIAPNIVPVMSLHAEVIRAAGGRTYLAGALRLEVETVKSWPKRGIPSRYWHKVVELARRNLPELTIDDLDRTKPSTIECESASPHAGAA